MKYKVENVDVGCIMKTQLKHLHLIVKRQETKEFLRSAMWLEISCRKINQTALCRMKKSETKAQVANINYKKVPL